MSKNGFWLFIDGQERFLSFDAFPWFRTASIEQLLDVQLCGPNHLRWPALDIDVAVASIDRPDDYPLISKSGARVPTGD